ncbi:MAG TPA: hypothetical protein VJA22_02790 [Patescibacteria group bacterium]|nr:hypothetical protein [Patescibacteria group bacterium]
MEKIRTEQRSHRTKMVELIGDYLAEKFHGMDVSGVFLELILADGADEPNENRAVTKPGILLLANWLRQEVDSGVKTYNADSGRLVRDGHFIEIPEEVRNFLVKYQKDPEFFLEDNE